MKDHFVTFCPQRPDPALLLHFPPETQIVGFRVWGLGFRVEPKSPENGGKIDSHPGWQLKAHLEAAALGVLMP